jgi:hypothetical protein
VLQAANALESLLKGDGQKDRSSYGGDLLMVYSGAWEMIRNQPLVQASELGESYIVLPPGGRALEVEGAMAFEPKDVGAILAALRAIIGEGGEIRALETLEMAEWWTYTGLAIEEPALVVETADGLKQFLFFFEGGRIVGVDELDALPDLL